MENINPAIERKETFQRELNSLHQKLDEKFVRLDASTRSKVGSNTAAKSTVEELNQVKIHRMKIRADWDWMQNATEEQWREQKSTLHANFEEAAKLI